MSSTLYWRPANEHGKELSDEMKFLLRKRWGDPLKVTLGKSDVNILEGMELAVEDKKLKGEIGDLIRAIDKCDQIVLEERW